VTAASPFTVERDGRVAVVVFDLPGKTVNLLSLEVGRELGEVLERLDADAGVEGVVLISGKDNAFIAGADIDAFATLTSEAEARALSADGQRMIDRVAARAKPLVAAIHGACLGGGLELALAADERIATDDDVTRLGLPEVQLGLIPGAGGCQRLPRLVGLRAALDLILTGRRLRASQARRIGLVDDVVPRAILREVAVATASRLAGNAPPRRRPGGPLAWLLDRNPLGRAVVFWQARRATLEKTSGHYPAPLAALDAVRHGLSHGMAAGLSREADHFGRLAVGPVSRRLVHIFLATNALKKDPGIDAPAEDVPDVARLGVVGAGFMGAAIAGVAALRAGVDVRVRDTDWPRVARGLAGARAVLDEARRRRRIDRHEHRRRAALLSGSPDEAGFSRRDLVVEAVFEDLDVKRGIIADLERVVPDACVLASNTSTLPIARLQEHARRPERVVGMHFFSPVDRMPLLEVIRGPASSPAAALAAVRFGQRMGKTAIVVRDAPGFWVNRILAPYLNESGWLLEEGAAVERVDAAMTAFGFPVGPFALLDEVGLDVAHKASAVLRDAFGERLAPAPVVARLVGAGRLGRKSGRGFYRYAGGRRRGVEALPDGERGARAARGSAPSAADIERRPILAMVNEAARALAEGVVASPRDADLGAVMGFGFPPFRGGPLRYADDLGLAALVDELTRLADRVGPRFAPAGILVNMAREGRAFSD
jgi:3-hydroxyacyl-CoA dehydrogenase/enoyl-CoA hydratase/3-hydroxybutyryl-CoA epimerase